MSDIRKDSVTFYTVGIGEDGQRIDNFLVRLLKGVPKSRIYRMLRSGEVRINKGRVGPESRLKVGDYIRIPPVSMVQKDEAWVPAARFPVVFEDAALLIINKPASVAVHGGSGVAFGVIEQLRQAYADYPFLELVHRLDRETSGLLMLAKKRSALVRLHAMLRENNINKRYLALAIGQWQTENHIVKLPLHKYHTAEGERRVCVAEYGLPSHTVFSVKTRYRDFSLVEAQPKTGRTHQIRVHMAARACPIAGDEKYGDFVLNQQLLKQGLKRMFLHAAQLSFSHPLTAEKLEVNAPIPSELQRFLCTLV